MITWLGLARACRTSKTITLSIALAAALVACKGASAIPGAPQPGKTAVPSVRDDWPMYGHDALHTSASVASISGPLKVAWRYDPQAGATFTFSQAYSTVATVSGAYVHWFQSAPTILGAGPSVDGVSVAGQRTWTFVEHRDYDEGHWLSIFSGDIVLNDDGEVLLDPASGSIVKTLLSSYDSWGETIPDPTGLYGTNTFIADGPNLVVYAFNSSDAVQWKALQQTGTKYSVDSAGGLLLANGVLYYAANYSDPVPHASGLYAFTASSGAQIAYAASTPVSEMSADAMRLYLVEQPSTLVARSLSNLSKVWSVSLASGSFQAPVMANGLVIVATFSGVEAHDAGTGKVVWTSSVQPASSGQYSTAMCAALGSGTLLVASYDGLHLLNLATGAEIWHGAVTGAIGTATNPVIVNDPARGPTVYLTDGRGVIALIPS